MTDDAQRQLQRIRLRMVGDIVAALAHDFGQPLNIIRLSAENGMDLCDHGGPDDGRRRAYGMIGQQAVRLQSTMGKLVGIARGARDAQWIDVPAAIDTVLADLRGRCAAEQVAVRWTPPGACPAICGLPDQVMLVFDTLLSNALDAVVHARMTRPAEGIDVSCHAIDGRIAVRIADEGLGMPQTVMTGLLDPLAETPPAAARPGVGLLLTAGIMAAMGGRLAIDASPQGTAVTAAFPTKG